MNRAQEFLGLIEKHKGILYKVSRMYSDDDESREDLYQEILYQLWRSFSSFKKESQFSTWMNRVVLNTTITIFIAYVIAVLLALVITYVLTEVWLDKFYGKQGEIFKGVLNN